MKFRRARYWTSLAAVGLCGFGLALATVDKAASRVTGTELVSKLAEAARIGNDRRLAQQLVGLELGARPDAPLTEKGAIAIMQNLGIAATSKTPDLFLTKEKAESLVRSVVLSSHAKSLITEALTGRGELPATVDDCFSEKNHGACVLCCKDLGGGPSSCAKACFVINKSSTEEPLP